MSDDERNDEKDPDLAAALRLWKVPPAPERLGQRLTAAYRSAGIGTSFWVRRQGGRVSLPIPLAALIVGALFVVGLLLGRHAAHVPAGGAPESAKAVERAGLANLRPLPEIRVTVLKEGADDAPR